MIGADKVSIMDGERFIYVFSEEARDRLLAAGYTLLKSDGKNNTYIFDNDPRVAFSFSGIGELKTDTLSF